MLRPNPTTDSYHNKKLKKKKIFPSIEGYENVFFMAPLLKKIKFESFNFNPFVKKLKLSRISWDRIKRISKPEPTKQGQPFINNSSLIKELVYIYLFIKSHLINESNSRKKICVHEHINNMTQGKKSQT